MSQTEQFDKLVQDAQRDDDYINATKWCKHFGYDLRNWKRLPETKAKLTELSERLKIEQLNPEVDTLKITQLNPEVDTLKIGHFNPEVDTLKITHSVSKELIYTSGKGYRAVTWVHPFMAVHLASYFDPDFANYVAQVFIRYAVADPTLAADIALRQETTEGLDIINKAVQERYEFLKSKLNRAYHRIQDAWGDKLHYSTLTGEIQLNGSPLELQSLKIKLDLELDIKVEYQDARQIVETLAIVNTYPLMDAANQQRFGKEHWLSIKRRNFVPTKECPTPPKLS
ncbi:KilA-N domain-containing protein [Nostoc sp.]